jgi:hypothetical protein
VVGRTGDWNLTFYVTAALYLLGAICWWRLDPTTPLGLEIAAEAPANRSAS